MRKFIIIGSLVMMLCLNGAGCAEKNDEASYISFVNDPNNKITQQIEMGGVTVTMKWLPLTYRRLMFSGSQQEKDSLVKEDGLYYFDVKLEKIQGDKPAKEKIMYLNFDMQQDFALAGSKDSIAPVFCQKIENGIGGSYEYMLAFESPVNAEEDFTVFYHDKIFGLGTVAFVYKQEDIRKIPILKSKDPE